MSGIWQWWCHKQVHLPERTCRKFKLTSFSLYHPIHWTLTSGMEPSYNAIRSIKSLIRLKDDVFVTGNNLGRDGVLVHLIVPKMRHQHDDSSLFWVVYRSLRRPLSVRDGRARLSQGNSTRTDRPTVARQRQQHITPL